MKIPFGAQRRYMDGVAQRPRKRLAAGHDNSCRGMIHSLRKFHG